MEKAVKISYSPGICRIFCVSSRLMFSDCQIFLPFAAKENKISGRKPDCKSKPVLFLIAALLRLIDKSEICLRAFVIISDVINRAGFHRIQIRICIKRQETGFYLPVPQKFQIIAPQRKRLSIFFVRFFCPPPEITSRCARKALYVFSGHFIRCPSPAPARRNRHYIHGLYI